jgi:hypothetical protein
MLVENQHNQVRSRLRANLETLEAYLVTVSQVLLNGAVVSDVLSAIISSCKQNDIKLFNRTDI